MSKIDAADVRELPPVASEISLTEIWLIVLKQRVVVLSMIGLCTFVGIIFGLLRGENYAVSIAIEIGSTGASDRQLIEEPTDTVAKLEESLIPALIAENPSLTGLSVKAETPKDTSIVKIRSTAPASIIDEARAALTRLAHNVLEEHEATVAPYRAELEIRVSQLSDEAQNLAADLEGLEIKRLKLQDSLNDSGGVEAVSMGFAYVEVERIIASTRVGLARAQRDLFAAQEQFLAIRSTRAVSPAIVATQPSGIGLGVVSLLSLLSGIVAGLIAALVVEFADRAGRLRNVIEESS